MVGQQPIGNYMDIHPMMNICKSSHPHRCISSQCPTNVNKQQGKERKKKKSGLGESSTRYGRHKDGWINIYTPFVGCDYIFHWLFAWSSPPPPFVVVASFSVHFHFGQVGSLRTRLRELCNSSLFLSFFVALFTSSKRERERKKICIVRERERECCSRSYTFIYGWRVNTADWFLSFCPRFISSSIRGRPKKQ